MPTATKGQKNTQTAGGIPHTPELKQKVELNEKTRDSGFKDTSCFLFYCFMIPSLPCSFYNGYITRVIYIVAHTPYLHVMQNLLF